MSKPSERIAIVGSPNSGKSSLFNRLTGLRQKVANYPGVTVEKRAGTCVLPSGKQVEILDLPGTYSLNPRSPDEALVLEAIQGKEAHRVVAVVDATRLDRQLFLALQILATGRPAMLVLNLIDEAESQGIEIDVPQLSRLLGVPVLAVSAKSGKQLREAMDATPSAASAASSASEPGNASGSGANGHGNGHAIHAIDPVHGYREVESIVQRVVRRRAKPDGLRGRLDSVLTHRVLGPVLFVALMATVFQGIYAWATPMMDALGAGFRSTRS